MSERWIDPGHMPVVMMSPDQYMRMVRPYTTSPYFQYFLARQLGQTLSDAFKLAAQTTLIMKTKGELPGITNFPMSLSTAARKLTLDQLAKQVFNDIGEQYKFLMDAWNTGNWAGMGSSFMSSAEQFMQTGQLLYAYGALQYQTSVIPRMKRYWNQQYTPTVPNASMAYQLFLRKHINEARFREYASYDGWDKEGTDFLMELWKSFPNVRSSFRMLMRGAHKYEEFVDHCLMSGWRKEDVAKLYKIYEWLPNARDAFRLLRRGKIKEGDYKSLVRGQGYDARWDDPLKDLWERIPLPHDAFNMLMRGVINTKDWKSYIHQNEWEDGAADYLYAIYQKIPSAHEAFYMEKKGLISVAVRDLLYKANGYDPKYHTALTENYYYVPTLYDLTRIADYVEIDLIWATKVLKERGLRDRDIAKIIAMLKIRPLRNEITRQITLWLNRRMYGWVSETEFEAAIQTYVDAGYVQTTEKTLLLEEGQLKYEDELMREQIEILEWEFRTAAISQDQLEQSLLDLGIVQEKVNLMVELLLAQGYYGYY